MILCEILLIGMIVALGSYVTITDLRRGIIQNKALAAVMLFGLVINGFYYAIYAATFFKEFCVNFIVLTVFAIALYAFHFWAAGDSKLLICLVFLFPARYYEAGGNLSVPGIAIVVLIFLISYAYVLADSVIQAVRGMHFFNTMEVSREKAEKFLIQYAIGFLYLRGLSQIFSKIFGDFYDRNQIIFTFTNIFIAIFIQSYGIFKKWYSLVIILICNLYFYEGNLLHKSALGGYGILLLVMLLRYFISGYNYQKISTETVEPGMILSYGTVAQFWGSRVKGLPNHTKEDMSTRISEDEAEAIKRWGKSKYGKAEIVVVRKLPFAVFIVLGVVAFFIIRVVGV